MVKNKEKIIFLKKNKRLIIIFREFSTSTSDGLLKEIKIIDFTKVIAGPTCILDLVDYGLPGNILRITN